MTPYQGDSPTDPRGQRPSGNAYGQPPQRPPQQPTGQFPGQQGQQGSPPQQGPPMQQGQSGQSQRMGQVQGTTAPGPAMQGQVSQMPQSGGTPGQMGPPTSQPGMGMQAQQSTGPGQQRPSTTGQQRLRPVRVEEIVQTDVVTAQRDTPIATVVAKMSDQDVGSVIVVENDQPIGILTDRKVALALENTPDVAQKQAGDMISGDLVTGTTSMSVFDVLQQFSDEGIRRLPIVDDDGSLEGIVTLDDLIVLLASELDKAGATIESQSPHY